MYKICAVIPAYNEEKKLGPVLENIKNHGIDAIVVDDGSTDSTAAIAKNKNAYLISHDRNEGKGKALRDGFNFAIKKGYDLILTLDADAQHDTGLIPSFIDELSGTKSDLVIGNRLAHHEGMPLYRFFINRLFSGVTSLLCRQSIPDVSCGYRLIRKNVLQSIALNSDRFDIDPEIIIKSAKAGFTIGFMKISCIYNGEFSHIKPLEYWNNFFRLIIKELKNN